ncbi:MAG: ABC transporter permease subunit [Oscillospiraceae bacterium]|jgi:ABC-2 type transport system permease protein|nr:ABC transporter permease subunit [Oscillospiraceae bacterium]
MVNYIHAECYKAFRRKYFYGFLMTVLGLAAAFMVLLRVEGLRETQTAEGMIMIQRVSVSELLGILAQLLSAGLYFLMIAADIVFSDQYKHNTLKNEVSYGLTRSRIYLGKLVSSALVAGVLCLILLGGYLVFSCILFPLGDGAGEGFQAFGRWLLMAFPLWMGGLGLFMLLQFVMKNTAATITYVMIVGFLGSGFIDLFTAFLPSLNPVADAVRTISLNTPFTLLMRGRTPEELMGYAWALGMGWLAVTTGVGLVWFQKKEIS